MGVTSAKKRRMRVEDCEPERTDVPIDSRHLEVCRRVLRAIRVHGCAWVCGWLNVFRQLDLEPTRVRQMSGQDCDNDRRMCAMIQAYDYWQNREVQERVDFLTPPSARAPCAHGRPHLTQKLQQSLCQLHFRNQRSKHHGRYTYRMKR